MGGGAGDSTTALRVEVAPASIMWGKYQQAEAMFTMLLLCVCTIPS